jgi:hypothetical protein
MEKIESYQVSEIKSQLWEQTKTKSPFARKYQVLRLAFRRYASPLCQKRFTTTEYLSRSAILLPAVKNISHFEMSSITFYSCSYQKDPRRVIVHIRRRSKDNLQIYIHIYTYCHYYRASSARSNKFGRTRRHAYPTLIRALLKK